MKLENIFSAFDGMSCGQIALNRQDISYENYYASEIDKWAIQVTQSNYSDTIQLGDIKNVEMLPEIDLMMGGSPCQSFSFSGKQQGMTTKENVEILSLGHYLELKEKGFEFQGQSYLFWEYMRMLKLLKPKYFLLENVMMTKKWKDILTNAIGVEPIMINSNLVSAQNRKRLYWTNIPNITQPEDRGILLKDIIEDNVPTKYNLTPKGLAQVEKYSKNYKLTGKSPTLTTELAHSVGKNITPKLFKEIGQNRRATPIEIERLQTVPKNYTNPKYKISQYSIDKYIPDTSGSYCDPYNKSMLKGEKSTTLRLNSSNGNMWVNDANIGWRKLTPDECELLQTVDLKFTKDVSDTQRYKMLGNGWTVDVIAHILSFIPD